jgi:putative ABC transport system permease protein
MFKNYLITAYRNYQHQKLIALISILGLSIGIACFSLLTLYAFNEFGFDKFNENAVNIYCPYVLFNELNGQPAAGYMDYSGPGVSFGETMKQDLRDVINYTLIHLP